MGKQCKKCAETHPPDNFYAGDSACKPCRRAMVRANYRRNREHYLAYERKRKRDPRRVQARREYAKKNQRTGRSAKESWAARNYEKRTAHYALSNAIRDGKITKLPCAVCCTTEGVQGHHEDYSRPLDVVWLCAKHHAEYHVVRRVAEAVLRKEAG